MEKSIETIWKEGFLKDNALVAPKLNNLYNQKSIHIVDKFRRMYKINIIAIFVFASILLPVTFIVKMQYMGVPMFVLFIVIAFFGIKFMKKLDKIDSSLNSYQYLNSFNKWLKEMVSFNTKLSRYLYPYIFLSMVSGFWFIDDEGTLLGEKIVGEILYGYPEIYMIYGIPIIGIIGIIFIVSILAFFGGRIGKWDMNLVYGRILRKLDILMADMEELRA